MLEPLMSYSDLLEKPHELEIIWSRSESQLSFLKAHATALRMLISNRFNAETGSGIEGGEGSVAHGQGESRALGDACSRAGIAVTRILSHLFYTACKDVESCKKISWDGVCFMDIVAAVARSCVRSDTLQCLSQLVARDLFKDPNERFSWYVAVINLLEGLLAFCNVGADKDSDDDETSGNNNRSSSHLTSDDHDTTLLYEILESMNKSYLLEHLAKGFLLHRREVPSPAATSSTSSSSSSSSNTSVQPPALTGVVNDVLARLLVTAERQLDVSTTAGRGEDPDAWTAYCPFGACMQYLMAAHMAAQLRSAETIDGCHLDDGRDVRNGGAGGSSSDAGSTMYGLSTDALPPVLEECCGGCTRPDCKASTLGTCSVRGVLRYWVRALEADEQTQRRQVISPRAKFAMSMRLAKVALLWWFKATGKSPRVRHAGAASGTGQHAQSAAAASVPPPQERRLTQKQMRQAKQLKQQAQQQQAEGGARAKQQQQRQRGLLAPRADRFRPSDCPSLAMDAVITAARCLHAGRRYRSSSSAGDGSGGSTAQDASRSREAGGEASSASGNANGSSSTSGGVEVAVLPEDWWRDALTVFDISLEEVGSLRDVCNMGGLYELSKQVTLCGTRNHSHHRGLLLSSSVAANLRNAHPLGLLPCLERVLRRGLPHMLGHASGLSGLFSILANEVSMRSLLLTAEFDQLVPYVVTSSKAVSRLVSKEAMSNHNFECDAMDAIARFSVPQGLLQVMRLCGRALAMRSAGMVDVQEKPAAEEGAAVGAACGSVPSGVANEEGPDPGCSSSSSHAAAVASSSSSTSAASASATEQQLSFGFVFTAGGATPPADANVDDDGGDADVSGNDDGGSSDLPGVSEVPVEAAERVLLLGSVMAARRLPAMAAVLPHISSYGINLLALNSKAQEEVASLMLRWVPLLTTAYLLALERGQVAAAAAWKQLLLSDIDVFSVMDVALAAAHDVTTSQLGRIYTDSGSRSLLLNFAPAVQAMILAFPDEMADAMAPQFTQVMSEALGKGASGGGARKGRLPFLSLVYVLRMHVMLEWEGSSHVMDAEQRHTITCMSGEYGDAVRVQANEKVRSRLLKKHGCVAERLTPPHLVSGRARVCGNPRCTNLAGDGEAELPLQPCGKCGRVLYCSRDCQMAHARGGHKELCALVRAAAAARR
ncbi:hypothetical protein Agub_g2464 [Astrephomene gubernaculifera]|uniref:phytol kinase n=1 Tax=Astrephomene gubernaculifera TaxID=47775 RepID=A0AAD3DH39_9CHLO|nr:hypothetical protein Agub_g2464 [Astrephomene gubernaculifera]